jgi:ADP-ribose pyrophosphatase YjhB (NUDIX family)
MNLFINDIPIKILRPGVQPEAGHYNYLIDARKESITKAGLIHHVWVNHADTYHLDVILELINSKVPIHLLSLYVTAEDYEFIKVYLKRKFKVVKAAGGLIQKKDRFLMMYRMKKWDLPKGKKDPGEKSIQTAEREVQEECNIAVKVGKKLCTTWHTYTMNKNVMLKQTKWFLMELTDDSKMKPSLEEDIEELRWMTRKEVYHALENSYKSIRFVFEEFYRKTDTVKG